jgi:hypothetical protein
MIQKDKCQYWRCDNNKNKEKEKKMYNKKNNLYKMFKPKLTNYIIDFFFYYN